MNDKRLLAIKHGRIMLPFVALIIILAVIHLNSDELVVQEIYAVGVMLIDFILVIYSLDSIVQLVGLCSDRLMLLSPKSRWNLVVLNVGVVSCYLLLAHIAGMIPRFAAESISIKFFWLDLLGYISAMLSGFGLMVFIIYCIKKIRSRSTMRICAWVLYLSIASLIAYCYIKLFSAYQINDLWIIGAVQSTLTCNVYAGLIPITLIDTALSTDKYLAFVFMNLGLSVIFWLGSWIFSKKKNNYLEVN